MAGETKSALDMLTDDPKQAAEMRVAKINVEIQELRLEYSQRIQRIQERQREDLHDAAIWIEAMTRPLIRERENIIKHLVNRINLTRPIIIIREGAAAEILRHDDV